MSNEFEPSQFRLDLSAQRLKDYQELAYKKKAQGKGYSVLLALAICFFLLLNSFDVSFEADNGRSHLELKTKGISAYVLVPCLLLIAAALGVDTDPLAETLGRFLTGRKSGGQS